MEDGKKYSVIVADPPWLERGSGKIKRGADRHYPLMKTTEIVATMADVLGGRVADDAHLYLWVTNNFLVDGLGVIDALGFRYVTNVVWIKNRPGLGQYFRGCHELCLFAVRGRGLAVRSESRSIVSTLTAAHVRREDGERKHSGKPSEFFDMVERRSTGERLEMFARVRRPGWDSWGNEV